MGSFKRPSRNSQNRIRAHSWASFMIIVGTFGTVGMFGRPTPVAFGTLRIGSVLSTLGIIPNEFW